MASTNSWAAWLAREARGTIGVALAIAGLIAGLGVALGVGLREADADGPVWPMLPAVDGAVELPAQEWPARPGDRRVRVLVHYPQSTLESVGPRTGVMLTLHNWGGTDCVGTANPRRLAATLNVVALCVNYVQSGPKDSIQGPEPYDYGYLQSLDALRALWWTCDRLPAQGRPFAGGRLFCTGGSGGGNVTLMAHKLAPRTFACVVDMCGMKKLSDDIAFHLPGGSDLNARYSREPSHPNYLSPDHQELRLLAHRGHLSRMKELGGRTKVVVVHGREDVTCPFADAEEMAAAMTLEGLDVEPRFIGREQIDGVAFKSAGHSLGDRTEIVFKVAGDYLREGGPKSLERADPTDFQRRETLLFPTANGRFAIDYTQGYPVGRFERLAPLPDYPDRTHLLEYRGDDGTPRPVASVADWSHRREHIVRHFERVVGPFPGPLRRGPLEVQVLEESRRDGIVARKLSYRSDDDDRVTAWLLIPEATALLPAVLCLHQTTAVGKDEPTGRGGDAEMRYALELTRRGFVTLSPDYPSLGEHPYDFAPKRGYVSGTMKAVWDNSRAVDLLETLPMVDPKRIGCIGHSLGGHNAIFTAVFEPRLRAIVSSCGFSTLSKDDVPSWTGPRYMPRIASDFGSDAQRVPFDFPELLAAIAPRPFLAVAATRDSDFDVSGVRDALELAKPIYTLFDSPLPVDAVAPTTPPKALAPDRLTGFYPEAPHSFPEPARKRAYEFLEHWLRHK
jgi:dienelactone hydrolase